MSKTKNFQKYIKTRFSKQELADIEAEAALEVRLLRSIQKMITDGLMEVSQEERWLFDPKNKEVVQELKKALQQKAETTIDLDDLEK